MNKYEQLAIVLLVAGCFMLSNSMGRLPAFGIFLVVFGVINLIGKPNEYPNQ